MYSFTVKPSPRSDVPATVIAVIDLDEQPGLRIVSNVTDCDAAAVTIGMPVEVHFEERDDVWLPLFRPRR